MRILYQLAVALLRALSPLLALGDSKLARGVAGRRHAHQKLATWGATLRDPDRPAVWLHAPSVGEGLQARAVRDAWLERRPDLQVAFTHFSPSAEGLAEDFGADVATYLPWDLRGPVARALSSLDPSAVVFTKTEVWPVVAAEAHRRGIPVAIVGATVPEGAGRARWPARALMRGTWASLDLACAMSALDAERLVTLGVAGDRVRVTGDPGIDSAVTRFVQAPRDAPYLTPFHAAPRPTVVAGSTWGADEAVLLPALRRVREDIPDVRAILAPHEPGAAHVEGLLRRLEDDGWETATLGQIEDAGDAGSVDAVVVDRVGVLAHLYGVASASFVGGGFHADGLHSVLEPAAAGSPVVFGPRHGNARAAVDLLGVGGAKLAANAPELGAILLEWLRDEGSRVSTGKAAAHYIEGHRGAAERTAAHLDDLMGRTA